MGCSRLRAYHEKHQPRQHLAGLRWNRATWLGLTPDILEEIMKLAIVCAAVLGLAFSSTAQAKGCIKGAIVGGVAGHMAGHGKVGAAAGCVIGHHEANKADAQKAAPRQIISRNDLWSAGGNAAQIQRAMKDFSNASFLPETIVTMKSAMDAAVATLPEPVNSAHVQRIAESILRTAKDGERDPAALQRMALLELQIRPRA